MRVLCCGEALIDMTPIKGGFAPRPGGAVFNTAVALGRLGVKTGFFSGLSDDLFGDQLRAALTGAGVDHSMAQISARPTTLAFVSFEGGEARYRFYDENSAGRMISAPGALPATPIRFFGGISLAVAPASAVYATLLTETPDDALVYLDPNIRPGFIEDAPAYRRTLSVLMARADVVKLSLEDLAWLTGTDTATPDAAAQIPLRPGQVLVLSMGAAGVLALDQDGEIARAAAPETQVVDTIGAGDCLNAGIIASLSALGRKPTHGDWPGALSFGAKVAAASVARPGADPPWADEVA